MFIPFRSMFSISEMRSNNFSLSLANNDIIKRHLMTSSTEFLVDSAKQGWMNLVPVSKDSKMSLKIKHSLRWQLWKIEMATEQSCGWVLQRTVTYRQTWEASWPHPLTENTTHSLKYHSSHTSYQSKKKYPHVSTLDLTGRWTPKKIA